MVRRKRAGDAVHRHRLDDRRAYDAAGAIRNAADAAKGHAGLLELFYFDLSARGIWFAKRGMMALSIALDEADGDKLVGAVEEFAETRAPLFGGRRNERQPRPATIASPISTGGSCPSARW